MVVPVWRVEAYDWRDDAPVKQTLLMLAGLVGCRRTISKMLPVVMPVTVAMVVEVPVILILERTINRGGLNEVIERVSRRSNDHVGRGEKQRSPTVN